MKTLALTAVAVAGAVALAAGPAAARGRVSTIDTHASGSFTAVADGTVVVTGTATGAPFDGTVTATLEATDGSLPDPGTCEPATATYRLEGSRGRFLELETVGDVCGTWVQPPTSVVTHVFTGRYVVTASSQRRLLGTDGFHEVRLGETGTASTFAIDT